MLTIENKIIAQVARLLAYQKRHECSLRKCSKYGNHESIKWEQRRDTAAVQNKLSQALTCQHNAAQAMIGGCCIEGRLVRPVQFVTCYNMSPLSPRCPSPPSDAVRHSLSRTHPDVKSRASGQVPPTAHVTMLCGINMAHVTMLCCILITHVAMLCGITYPMRRGLACRSISNRLASPALLPASPRSPL